MKNVCPNILDIDGCSSHQGNLLSKDLVKKFSFVMSIVHFVEKLSNYLESKPKVRSIMQQCSAILDVKKVPEYSDTRFLNMYTIVESITDQFPVIEKVVRLDKAETELKQIVSSKFMPVHLDQFVVHIKPLYDLTKATQGLNGSIYDLLVLFFLEFISKLLVRLGYNVLSPVSYYYKLYSKSTCDPLEFVAKNKDFQYSSSPLIYHELCKMTDRDY